MQALFTLTGISVTVSLCTRTLSCTDLEKGKEESQNGIVIPQLCVIEWMCLYPTGKNRHLTARRAYM